MELDDNSLLSIQHHPLTCKTNGTKKKKKGQKLEKPEYSRWEIAFVFEPQRKQTEKARRRQRGSTELVMSESESHEVIVKEEYTDKISSPVPLS